VQASIQTLAKLKHLDTIVLNVSNVENEKKVEQMVLKARAVLTASPSIERKTLVVERFGATDTILLHLDE
jgi:hypothetical protein